MTDPIIFPPKKEVDDVVERELQQHTGLRSVDGFEDIPFIGRIVMGVALCLAIGYALISVPAISKENNSFNYWYGMGQTSKRYGNETEAYMAWLKFKDRREKQLASKKFSRKKEEKNSKKKSNRNLNKKEIRRTADKKTIF